VTKSLRPFGTMILAVMSAFALASCASNQPTNEAALKPAPSTGVVGTVSDGGTLLTPLSFFGGPVYIGTPAPSPVVAFVNAGGGSKRFSTEAAWISVFGRAATERELSALSRQFGRRDVDSFLKASDLIMADSLELATPSGSNARSSTPAKRGDSTAFVKSGLDKDGVFYMSYLLDRAVSHQVVIKAVAEKLGRPPFTQDAAANFFKTANRAYFDFAITLGMKGIHQAASSWTPSSNTHVLSTPGGVAYQYTGTGVPSGNENALRLVAVKPGRAYVFSAWVDPSHIKSGDFDLVIDKSDGSSTYQSIFHGNDKAGLFKTSSWTCPQDVTQVLLGMQLIEAVVTPGEKLQFMRPTLQELGGSIRPL
jgi:hypothetical protein